MMKLSIILILAVCQFSIEAKFLALGSRNLSMQDECSGLEQLGQVENMKVSYSDNTFHVEWEPPKEIPDCELNYQVTLEINNELTADKTTNELSMDFVNVSLKSCENAIVNITAKHDALVGPTQSTNVKGELVLYEVVNLKASHSNSIVHVEWEAPKEGEQCKLEYMITLAIDNEDPRETTVNNEFEVDFGNVALKSCENAIVTVKANLGPIAGPPQTTDVEGELLLGQVEAMAASYSNNVVSVEWAAPTGTAACELDYQITLEINNEFAADKTVNSESVVFNDISLQSSDKAIVTVIAKRDAVTGPARTNILEGRETGQVTDLIIEGFVGGDTLVSYKHSDFTYAVNVSISTCLLRNASVTVSDANGANNTYFSNEQPQKLGPVKNLVITTTSIYMTARWSPPTGLEDDCQRQYRVIFRKNDGTTEEHKTAATEYNYYDCTTVNEFSVETMAGSVTGDRVTATIACQAV